MTRSFGWSVLIHAVLLVGVLLLLAFASDNGAESAVLLRPMKIVTRPELPKMVAGDGKKELVAQPDPVLPPPAPASPKEETASAPALSPTAPSSAPKEKLVDPRPLLSEPSYPTHEARPNQGGPGHDPVDSDGEKKGKDRPAIPYYKPTISLEEQTGEQQILVRFEVAENGTCRVEMLEGTGDIHRDARVLNVLRRWKWLPMRIDGRTYPSVEVLRFYRRDL